MLWTDNTIIYLEWMEVQSRQSLSKHLETEKLSSQTQTGLAKQYKGDRADLSALWQIFITAIHPGAEILKGISEPLFPSTQNAFRHHIQGDLPHWNVPCLPWAL